MVMIYKKKGVRQQMPNPMSAYAICWSDLMKILIIFHKKPCEQQDYPDSSE
jgi:hypothetical protein